MPPKEQVRQDVIAKVRRVVVKIGSGVLAAGGELDLKTFRMLARDIAAVKAQGREVVIVSSGAIASGMGKLGFATRPKTIPLEQACAAVGQTALMLHYEKFFSRYHQKVAQVLLTHDDLGHRQRFLNARNTLFTLLALGEIPVINENDSVVVDEITFGDNDRLSALVTNLVEADLLIILTDTDGLYDRDPKRNPNARLLPLVEKIDEDIEKLAEGTTSRTGTGGMVTKVEAARCASAFGTPAIIANGKRQKTLTGIFSAREVGTLFLPQENKLKSRKHWIAYNVRPKGCLVVDRGAFRAVVRDGKSLLPSGLKEVRGSFERGELVRCLDIQEVEFARGLVNYSSAELARIKGLNTREIERCLGYHYYDEVIHRDDLVVLKGR